MLPSVWKLRGVVANRSVLRHLLVNSNSLSTISSFPKTSFLPLTTPQSHEKYFSSSSSSTSSSTSNTRVFAGTLAGCLAALGIYHFKERSSFSHVFAETEEEKPLPYNLAEILAGDIPDVPEPAKKVVEHMDSYSGDLPTITNQKEFLSFAPRVPPPLTRRTPARLVVKLTPTIKTFKLSPTDDYDYWTFNGNTPGPFIRCRVGDVLEVHNAKIDVNGMQNKVDFQAAFESGVTPVIPKETSGPSWMKMIEPGLYVYHSSTDPIAVNVANGMFGLILVEPEDGMPPTDREFYIMQSEFYVEPGKGHKAEFSFKKAINKTASYICFNGRVTGIVDFPLIANQGEHVRMYVGNAGPNLPSSFKIFGSLFNRVYKEGDMKSPPAKNVSTAGIPVGSASVIEFDAIVPGNYSIVEHSLFRIEKGALGYFKVLGDDLRKDIFGTSDYDDHPNVAKK